MPDVMGGVETHCEELYPRVLRLANTDMQITVIGRRPYISTSMTYKGVNVVPVYAPSNKYLETIVHTAWAIILSKFKYKADIVHIHAIGPSILVPLAKILAMKVIVTHHGEDYRRAKWNFFAKAMLKTGENLARRMTDRLIVITNAIENRLASLPGTRTDRLRNIPNGIAPQPESGDYRNLLSAKGLQEGRYMVAVGRLVPEKGFMDLISAWKRARSQLNGQKLVIVGDSDHRDEYSTALLAEAADDVVFTGRLPRDSVFSLLRGASLFVLPSHHEGLPFAALEALSCGASVLLSDIPGNRELGLPERNYFPVGNIDALSNALKGDHTVLRPDSLSLERFNWDRIAEATLEVYQELYTPEGMKHAIA